MLLRLQLQTSSRLLSRRAFSNHPELASDPIDSGGASEFVVSKRSLDLQDKRQANASAVFIDVEDGISNTADGFAVLRAVERELGRIRDFRMLTVRVEPSAEVNHVNWLFLSVM